MADNQFKIGASIEVNDEQVKTEFTKAGELAGQSLADGLEKQEGNIQDKITQQIDNLQTKLEDLASFDWEINVNSDNAQEYVQLLGDEITDANRKLYELQDELNQTGEDGGEAFEKLRTETQDFASTLIEARGQLKEYADNSATGFDDLKDSVDKTTEAVQKLNDTAEQGASENKGVGKLIKFLGSAQIMRFFYNQLKDIGAKLIELSGDSEKLATKWGEVQEKFETLGGYLGKGLTPVLESIIDDIGEMTDEILGAGQGGEDMAKKFVKAGNIIGNVFRGIIKLIKNVGEFIGTEVANIYVLMTAVAQDSYDTIQSLITGIGDTRNWEALGNNIKYGVVQGVNAAIESLNGMLKWIKNNLGIDLGHIDTFDSGQKQDFSFITLYTGRTEEALKDIVNTGVDLITDIGDDWKEFFKDVKDGWEDIENTTYSGSKKIKKNVEENLGTGKGGGSKKDSVKSAFEELEEFAEDIWGEMSSLVESHQKSYDKLTEQIEKLSDSYDKLRDEAKKTREDAEKSLKDYNDELNKTQTDTITELGQRYVELKKELIGVDEWMKKVANKISWEDIGMFQDWGLTEYEGYDLKDLVELKEKLDEIKLIEENTTEEQRKSDEFIKETSKTQEILNKQKEKELEIEEKKASALEKQAIAQSAMNQGDGEQFIKTLTKNGEEVGTYYWDTINKTWKKIHDTENIEYAKQLENQTQNLNDQLEQYQKEKDYEVEILIDTTARKIELENEFQAVFEENAKKQEKELENIISLTDELIAKKREYLSMGETLHNAYGGSVLEGRASIVGENGPEQIIARQSSYIQPRNAGNSYNTVNNNGNTLSINGIEVRYDNMDDMLDALKERLTYRS